MQYFNYHAIAKKLIAQKKLIAYYYTQRHNKISPALVLLFDDYAHPVLPIRQERWKEYEKILPEDKRISKIWVAP
ncbi:MAG: thermostable hemolysin delta-VPH [Ruminococcaceae bacterium]|nr:thermostable hemolysin delta-VPH [Oscillospiraceae bacterium]